MTRFLTTLILLIFNSGQAISQTCENYNRNLFHFLPDNFPDSINCYDNMDKKQGWWIYYRVHYNPVDQPDVLKKGDYVPDYIYGQYKDDRKIGTWTSVNNVHLIFKMRQDSYYYSVDTSRVTSWFAEGGINESDILYLKNGTIIKSTSLPPGGKYPICIDCNKKSKKCIMTYRNKVIKKFPFDHFQEEFSKSFFLYGRIKQDINTKQN